MVADDERNLFLKISQTAKSVPYQQIRLLREADFDRFLRDQDIRLSSAISLMRRSGFIAPVLVQGEVSARERKTGRLSSLGEMDGESVFAELPLRITRHRSKTWVRDRRAKYHPFQIWLVLRFQEYLQSQINAMALLVGGDRNMRMVTRHAEESWRRLREYRQSDEYTSFLKLMVLLISIEPLVVPSIRSRLSLPPGGLEAYRAWSKQQNGRSLLRRSGLKLSDVKEWHQRIASHASSIDPNERWFDLMRNASFDARMRLKGRALLAHTLYEMAEMLRRFAEGWLNKEWLEENDTRHGPYGRRVKENLYGEPRIADGEPKVMTNIIRHFG
ncbi:MAG: hypothetical protein WBD55_12285, partial [Dehalococcoidia bacterium]